MNKTGLLGLSFLSLILLTSSVNTSIFADNHNVPPIALTVDEEIISNGHEVEITGQIKDYDPQSITAGAVTYVVKSPDNNLVTIGQVIPNSDGSFDLSFIAGGNLWKKNGDYTVQVKYGGNESNLILDYVGGEMVLSIDDEDVKRGNLYHLNGERV